MNISDNVRKLFVKEKTPVAHHIDPDLFPKEADDFTIWLEFKNGSESAFSFIYKKYFDNLLNYGLQFTKDQELVKDLIQDFFIDLREKRGKLGNTDSIKYYLFKSLRRKITKYLKKEKKLTFPINVIQSFHVVLSHESILINQQLDQEQAKRLEKAFAKLTPKQREVVFYIFYENLSYKEIASILGLMNIKSARNILYRAIDSIKKNMEI